MMVRSANTRHRNCIPAVFKFGGVEYNSMRRPPSPACSCTRVAVVAGKGKGSAIVNSIRFILRALTASESERTSRSLARTSVPPTPALVSGMR